jgi:hypothetical protein
VHDLHVIAAIQEDSRSFKVTLHGVRAQKKTGPWSMTIGPERDFTLEDYTAARGAHGCVPVNQGVV